MHPTQNLGGYLIFGPGHILIESWGAWNSGGYLIFKPKYIPLEIQVAIWFLSQNISCSKFGWLPDFQARPYPGWKSGCSKFRWIPDFRPQMHPAQNPGGYSTFEPECILLKIQVGTNFWSRTLGPWYLNGWWGGHQLTHQRWTIFWHQLTPLPPSIMVHFVTSPFCLIWGIATILAAISTHFSCLLCHQNTCCPSHFDFPLASVSSKFQCH